jgi:Kef-type K+ transport system membrane component KefB
MCCVLVGFIIFAEELRSVSILGAYCAGVVFSGVSGGRLSWEHNTRNLSPWLLRLFFACTVGFTIPYRMWVWKDDALAGFFVGVMAIIGKILGGSLASLPFLGGVDWPLRIAQSLQIGSAMSVHGHIGIFALTQIISRGLVSQHSASGVSLGPAMHKSI